MPDKIHLTVATVIERGGKFLMVKERDKTTGEMVLNQPAGHVNPGETLTSAALRETLEETGWEVELDGIIGISIFTAPSNGITYYRVTFSAKPVQQLHQQLDSDIDEALWLDISELKQARTALRSPIVMEVINDFQKGIRYPLDMIREHR